MGGPPDWLLGEVLTSPYRKTFLVTKARNWTRALASAVMNHPVL
jgi:hypothetical protein